MDITEQQLLTKILYQSLQSGNSWYNNEVKKAVYMNDKKYENQLRRLHNALIKKADSGELIRG